MSDDSGVSAAGPAVESRDPFTILRVLLVYRAHQPHWNGARIVCRCGEEWIALCPVLEKFLANLVYPW